ncbi:hypothetical protein ACFPWS_41365 [Streptomyces aureus]|uniref:hypothetical protein n=1 Tax=Streptomyces TaxID=1883 RepID=UPI0031DCB3E0
MERSLVQRERDSQLGSVRVEAFLGMSSDLYELIKDGQVEEYRRIAHRLSRKVIHTADGRTGSLSLQPDGTVIAPRILPLRQQRRT